LRPLLPVVGVAFRPPFPVPELLMDFRSPS
jgi:hypothetical protein